MRLPSSGGTDWTALFCLKGRYLQLKGPQLGEVAQLWRDGLDSIVLQVQGPVLWIRIRDPDPYWIRIQSGLWIRIRIRNPDPDPDPGGQKMTHKSRQ
jgi:hypothetical protein